MATDGTALGDRMKRYENVHRTHLPGRTYTIIRVDGRAFHTYLRKAERPFDERVANAMERVTTELCRDISGSVLGYTQSDEASVLAVDFADVHTEPWFGGAVQKIASVSASIATVAFSYDLMFAFGFPQFDARVFTIPGQVDVANYFLWRQRDAERNSVSALAHAHFPHERLQYLGGNRMQELLWIEKGVNWNDCPDRQKRGSVVTRVPGGWQARAAPHFVAEPASFLADAIPPLPAFSEAEPEVREVAPVT